MKKLMKFVKGYRFMLIGAVVALAIAMVVSFFARYTYFCKEMNDQFENKKDELISYLTDMDVLNSYQYEDKYNNEPDDESEDSETEYNASLSEYYDEVLARVFLMDDDFLAVYDKETGKLIYSQNDILDESDEKPVFDEKFHKGKLDGIPYFVKAVEIGDVQIYSFSAEKFVIDKCIKRLIGQFIAFFVAILILVAHIVFLRGADVDPEQEIKIGKKYYLKDQCKKYIGVAVFLGIIFAAVTILIQNLYTVTERLYYLEMADVPDLSEVEDEINYEKTLAVSMLTDVAEDMNSYLVYENIDLTRNELSNFFEEWGLFDYYGVSYVSVFDKTGKTIATTSPYDGLSLFDDKDSSFYECRKLLSGRENLVVKTDSDLLGVSMNMLGIPYRNKEGNVDGILAFFYTGKDGEIFSDDANLTTYNEIIADRLKLVASGEDSCALIVSTDGTILMDPDDYGYGLDDGGDVVDSSILKDGYQGVAWGDVQYLAVTKKLDTGDFAVLLHPVEWFKKDTIITGLRNLLLYILIAIWFFIDGLGSRYSFKEEAELKKEEKEKAFKELMESQDAADNGEIPIEAVGEDKIVKKTPDEKMSLLIKIIFHIFALAIIISYFRSRSMSDSDTMDAMGYIFGGGWDKSLNMFAIVADLEIILVTWALVTWISEIMSYTSKLIGNRGETVCTLLSNLIKYVGFCLGFYIAALNIGIDAKATLASLGIAAMALGLGAKDMISDIFAGIFILFEGNYKVGDMITMDGDWYWVKSIGIRTTKIEAWGSCKVVNNSQMTGIVNIEKGQTSVDVDVPISSEYPRAEIEAIWEKELPLLNKNYPPVVFGPVYKGIVDFNGVSVSYRIRSYTKIYYQGWVKRQMRGEIIDILNKYNIKVPKQVMVIEEGSQEEQVSLDIQE